jgi:hypothetical protein
VSTEARKNAVALAIAGIVVGVVVFFVVRPAALLGVQTGALADSVAAELDGRDGRAIDYDRRGPEGTCNESKTADGRYRCSIKTVHAGDVGSGAVPTRTDYAVDAGSLGCWDATKLSERAGGPGPTRLDGCIGLFDY